ncbi:MAG TPA: ABC transporter permease [Planctomycetota bacterium]|nr:ABC transporter permease [Planctomycetota bacterium]
MPEDAGVSPTRLAWRRLRRSRAAMVSLAVVAAVSLACLAAPLGGDPQRQHAWLGARGPGYAHPDCLSDNVFAVGAPAETAARARAATDLVITSVAAGSGDDYRVALRRGVIRAITRVRGGVAVPELDLAATPGRELLAGEALGGERAGAVLRVGEAPPAGWFGDQPVLMLRVNAVEVPVTHAMTLVDGVVSALTRDGVAIARASIAGGSVRQVVADGAALTLTHPLGTDLAGRDVLARALYGGRVSLAIGLVATAMSLLIGVLYGAIAGYCGSLSPRGGRVDRAMMGAVDILYAVPFMFLVIVLLVNFGRSIGTLFIALAAVQWLTMARIVRGQVLSLATREFVAAAKLCGAGHASIILGHLIPNTLGIVVVYATLTVPAVILQEGFLAFIGLSVQWNGEALDSWGALVKYGVEAIGTGGERAWLLLVPSILMATSLIALNVLGDGVRDALDPHLKGRE